YSIDTLRPSIKPVSFNPCRMTAIRSASVAGERLLRIPITGSCCCARAASGQAAAAPPSSVTNARRLIRSHFGGRQIDDEVKLRRLLDWNVAWLRSAQNLIDVVTRALE